MSGPYRTAARLTAEEVRSVIAPDLQRRWPSELSATREAYRDTEHWPSKWRGIACCSIVGIREDPTRMGVIVSLLYRRAGARYRTEVAVPSKWASRPEMVLAIYGAMDAGFDALTLGQLRREVAR